MTANLCYLLLALTGQSEAAVTKQIAEWVAGLPSRLFCSTHDSIPFAELPALYRSQNIQVHLGTQLELGGPNSVAKQPRSHSSIHVPALADSNNPWHIFRSMIALLIEPLVADLSKHASTKSTNLRQFLKTIHRFVGTKL
jgi:hypothetical protein